MLCQVYSKGLVAVVHGCGWLSRAHLWWPLALFPDHACGGPNELLPLTDDEVVARVKSRMEVR
jgi:hypothetical protein